MGKWLDLLAEKKTTDPHPMALSKLSEPPFDSFGSGVQGGYRDFSVPDEVAAPTHGEPWDDATCARFSARVVLFLRRGLTPGDADDLAERLVSLDRDRCGLRVCLECRHLVGHASNGWRCRRPRQAGVAAALPDELARLGQRCPTFKDANTMEMCL